MAVCVTCGKELHPERAERYDYCTDPECHARNAKPLDIVAIGVNKAADQYEVLAERTAREMASGRYKRRPEVEPSPRTFRPTARGRSRKPAPVLVPRSEHGRPEWSEAQENLALVYRAMGMKPAEIAGKLGVSERLATKILLTATARGKP